MEVVMKFAAPMLSFMLAGHAVFGQEAKPTNQDTELKDAKKSTTDKITAEQGVLDAQKTKLQDDKAKANSATSMETLNDQKVKTGLESDWLNIYGVSTNSSFLNGDTKSTSTHGKGMVAEIQWNQQWANAGIFWPFFQFRSYSEDPADTTVANASGGQDAVSVTNSWKSWELGLRWYWPSTAESLRPGLIVALGRETVENDTTPKTTTPAGTTTTSVLTGGTGRVGFRLDRIHKNDPQYGSYAEFGFENDRRFDRAHRFYLTGRYTVLGNQSLQSLQVFAEARTSFYPSASSADKWKNRDEFSLLLGIKVPISTLLPKATTN
jgi:hypothetical protein